MNDDESGVHDAAVALLTSPSAVHDPDIMTYTSSGTESNFVSYDAPLVHGMKFYVAVKVTNRANGETIKVKLSLEHHVASCFL